MATNPVYSYAGPQLEPSKEKASATIRLSGRITAATSASLQRSLSNLISRFDRVVLDLSNVDHIDGFGVGVLADVYLQAKQTKCELEIANSVPRLRDLVNRWFHSVFEGNEEFLGMTPD